jgi:hypothetical protein
MSRNKNPAPRANAGSRANSKSERTQNRASASVCEADTAAVWFSARLATPSAFARVLAALASLGRALQ